MPETSTRRLRARPLRLIAGAATVGALLFGVSACGSPPPLAPAGVSGMTTCLVATPANRYTFGTAQLTNRSRGQLTIQDVTLADAHNMQIIGARIGSQRGPNAVSGVVLPGFPPAQMGFAHTIPAGNARIPANGAGSPWVVWVGVRVVHPGEPASIGQIEVHYDGLGAIWTWRGGGVYQVSAHC